MKIIIADDHAIMREGLRMILEAQPDMTVAGETDDGRKAVSLARKLRPDVVVMDIAMAGLNGIEATARIAGECPATRVVILSMHSGSEYIARALKSGALGYVLKESAGRELVEAVRSVHAGKRFLSQAVAAVVAENYLDQLGESQKTDPIDRLSTREREVLQLVAEGKTSRQIAEIIHVSPKSIDTYRSRVMLKLGIDNLPALIKFAIQHGVIEVGTWQKKP